MPSPYPRELRDRVVKAWNAGDASMRAIGERFDVAERTVARWIERLRDTGKAEPLPMGGARRAYLVDEAGSEFIRTILDTVPDLTIPEICGMYEEERGVRVSPQTMSDTLRRLGYTRKRGSSAGWPRAVQRSSKSAGRSLSASPTSTRPGSSSSTSPGSTSP